MMGRAGFTKNSSNIKVDGIPSPDQRYRERPPSGGLFVWYWQVSCERLATHPVLDRRCASAEQGHDLQVLF
jgi:hypothetical protein